MPTVEQARGWYPDQDPVHGFDHILRVLTLAERLAQAEGADLEIVRAAVLLHDASGGETGSDQRDEHQYLSAKFARQVLEAEDWTEERIGAVEHAIIAHRFRDGVHPETLEAQVLFDADKLDVIGAFGVQRTIAYDVEVGQPPFAIPSKQFMETREWEEGEPHSSYHEFLVKLVTIKNRLYTETARRIAEGRHQFMVAFFEQLLAEHKGER